MERKILIGKTWDLVMHRRISVMFRIIRTERGMKVH